MIQITLGQLRNPEFSKAYQKLMQTTGLEPKIAYHIARVGDLLQTELKVAEQAHKKLVEEWAEFKNEDGQTFWKVPDDKIEAWTQANMSFHLAEAKVDKRKLLINEIEKANLTPAEYLALDPVLAGFEVLEGGSDGSKKDDKEKS